jgi:RNA polymerase sigma-70 factor (ECF subfamily)
MALEDPDLALVRALQAGEDRALDSLIGRHQEGLFRFIFRHIPNQVDATELTEETFIRAYFNIRNFRPTAKFVTWLYRIALNLCRDYSRRQVHRYSSQTLSVDLTDVGSEGEQQLMSVQPSPDKMAEDREKLRALNDAINELPQDLKSPLLLTVLEGLSHIETGRLLGISAKAVETKVYRARKRLLERMSKSGF